MRGTVCKSLRRLASTKVTDSGIIHKRGRNSWGNTVFYIPGSYTRIYRGAKKAYRQTKNGSIK